METETDTKPVNKYLGRYRDYQANYKKTHKEQHAASMAKWYKTRDRSMLNERQNKYRLLQRELKEHRNILL